MTLYESDKDRVTQKKIADQLAQLWKCDVMTMPKRHPVDFLFGDTSGACWIEVKRRYVESKKYATLIIDKEKLVAGHRHSEATGLPFGIVVHWNDGIFFARVDDPSEYQCAPGGRRDRGDANDIDIVAHIPTQRFERLL